MTDTITPTAQMNHREFGEMLWDNMIQVDWAQPIVTLAGGGKEYLEDEDLEKLNGMGNALAAMRLATPIPYREEGSDELKTREATAEDAERYRLRFCRLLYLAGGDPNGYSLDDDADHPGHADTDDDDDDWASPRMRKEMACEDLIRFLADTVGWVIQITTPVRQAGGMFTWGYTTSACFWGPDFNTALDAALASDLFDRED